MSQNITNVAQQMWDPLFETQLQNTQVLDGLYRVYASVEGNVYNRRLGSFGEMSAIGYNASNIPVSSINYSETPIDLFPYAYKTVVSDREMTLVGSDTPSSQILQEQAREHAMALGRYKDYLILNSIYSDVSRFTATTIPKTTGYGTGMNTEKIIAARSLLQDAGALSPEMSGVMPALLQQSLLKDTNYSSWFYNRARNGMPASMQANATPHSFIEYYDVVMRIMNGKGVNALPYTLVSTNRTYLCPVWDKDVITLATSTLTPKTTIWYNPGEHRYEIVSEMVMGAGVTQNTGVALITADTANTTNA